MDVKAAGTEGLLTRKAMKIGTHVVEPNCVLEK